MANKLNGKKTKQNKYEFYRFLFIFSLNTQRWYLKLEISLKPYLMFNHIWIIIDYINFSALLFQYKRNY